jgi:hypothetical protein
MEMKVLNKDKFTFLLAVALGWLCSGVALAGLYRNIDYGLEVPIPDGWQAKWCMSTPPAPNHGFAIPFQGRGCGGLFEKPRIDFNVEGNALIMATRPEELIDFYCEKRGARRTRYFSGKTPIYECNDIHEKNGLTAKTYFLLREDSHQEEEVNNWNVVTATYFWKGNDYTPAYKQETLNLLINIHWIGDFAEAPK